MTVAELIDARKPDWDALDAMTRAARWTRREEPQEIARFAALYRAVCSDLALAETYQLPPDTVRRFNDLVGRAHNRLYRRRRANIGELWRVFWESPRWLLSDVMFWVALFLFWAPFLTCDYVSRLDPAFAARIVGKSMLTNVELMYALEMDETPIDRLDMVAYYIFNNGGIALRCFAVSVLGCFPGLFILMGNAVFLGCVFGYMQSGTVDPDAASHFLEFTTAHGPFELTGIVLSAAAGMRIGFGAICTRGYSRLDSIRRSAVQASPAMVAAFVLLCLAATIEAFVSPSGLSFFKDFGIDALTVKRAIKIGSIVLLVLYFAVLGGGGFVVKHLRRFRTVKS